jgi:hypothetical protein
MVEAVSLTVAIAEVRVDLESGWWVKKQSVMKAGKKEVEAGSNARYYSLGIAVK